jgi:tetratricopeptide (TPR) repeat protein
MIDNLLNEVKGLKNDAKLLRDIGDTDGAVDVLSRAIANVEAASTGTLSSDESSRLKAQLADLWGMKGGVYRRAGKLSDALQSYETGLGYESGDSYNLTNSLILQVLIDPTRLEQLKPKVEAARDEVERQIRTHRSGQWWAWADLGLLEVLSGREEQAFAAYKNFGMTGARASDYDSTIAVLQELANRFAGNNEPVRTSLLRTVDLLKRLRP